MDEDKAKKKETKLWDFGAKMGPRKIATCIDSWVQTPKSVTV